MASKFFSRLGCFGASEATPTRELKVCVIGAGPSGTAVLRAFASEQAKGNEVPQVVCFEKQTDVGGLWNFSWRTGLDTRGEPVHNSMYHYLWSNGPKECLEFADYTFEEHFGRAIPSFPPREVLYDYIRGRLDKAGVRDWIKFEHAVRNVTYDAGTGKFTVAAKDLADCAAAETVDEFDYVICCSGHFSTPNVPEFPGFAEFNGRVLHAHDFREATEFKGKSILIIGTSYSAEDIASQCYKYGVGEVHLSWRTAPMGFAWPSNFTNHALLTSISPNGTCTFKDGSTAKVDAVILCTGYLHHFPFVHDSLRLKTANRLWCDNLYNGIALEANPRMLYIGMQDQWFTFNMFDAQAWWARDVILGRIAIPDAAAQKEHFDKWRTREATLASDEDMFRYQGDYIKDLISTTDYPSFDVDGVCEEFNAWEHNKHESIMGFRDKPHKSRMTGTIAPIHHTPWLKALDDSMPCYLNLKN